MGVWVADGGVGSGWGGVGVGVGGDSLILLGVGRGVFQGGAFWWEVNLTVISLEAK